MVKDGSKLLTKLLGRKKRLIRPFFPFAPFNNSVLLFAHPVVVGGVVVVVAVVVALLLLCFVFLWNYHHEFFRMLGNSFSCLETHLIAA